jgi:hypothetical protein
MAQTANQLMEWVRAALPALQDRIVATHLAVARARLRLDR